MTPGEAGLTAVPGGKAGQVGQGLQTTCARPGCTVMFEQTGAPGRPSLFHHEECRRQAYQERRVLRRRLKHHEEQASYLRAVMAAYERSAGDDDAPDLDGAESVLAPGVVRAAEDAVVGMRGVARFLKPESGEYAAELLRFFRAVAPVIDYHRTSNRDRS
jgi:hypothetical protein